SSGSAADVSGRFIDDGNNLIGRRDGATGFTNSVLVGSAANPIDPMLAPLANHGGPTKTHAPLVNSVALDAGSNVNSPAVDQRGGLRFAGSAVDIGAVELTAVELLAPPPIEISTAETPTAETPITETPIAETPIGDVVQSTLLNPNPTSLSTDEDLEAGVLTEFDRQDPVDNNVAIRRLERNFGQSFEDYWNLDAKADLSFDQVQAVLQRAQDEYAVNSAVVYAMFESAEDREDDLEKADNEILNFDSASSGEDLLSLSVVMPAGELVRYESSITRREAERQVRMLRATVADPEDNFGYTPLTQQLYQWLLAPLEEDLAEQGIQNLMYALDQGLRTAPVSSMRDYNGFSLERFGISVVPNMGLMQTDFSVPVRRTTVAMGVSEFSTEAPLPAVPIELDMVKNTVPVSQTVLNQGTTAEALATIQAVEQPGILHIATHASFDIHSPESSSIQLWDDPLSMKEFSDLDWRASNLELLILSACSTAMSSPNSELGFAGLAAASGVDASVGSLWQVSDVGTLALMSEFYAQLESTDLRFEALRQAQLSLLKGETRIEGGNLITSQGEIDLPDAWDLPDSASLDHPFFWSAFTMVGNPW
ncbi:MAG: CHAT domain-containing protein, partial [Cyanobacteria bacterium J06598_3]